MKEMSRTPDCVFATSWEVCNKVGGIYTVLSTQAKTLQGEIKGNLVYIGPDFKREGANVDFLPDENLHPEWREAAARRGVPCRLGRWDVPGKPIVALVDFTPLFSEKNDIYAEAWRLFGVDSLHAYGDYDEASMFSCAAGRFAEAVCAECMQPGAAVAYQAHEWMSGLGMLFLKHAIPSVATVFTTHATSIGRSITGNGKQLYAYFDGYNGDQMAAELNMEAKHSVEKQSALRADCFTTVSSFTDRECAQLLDKPADVVLPNGFEPDFVPAPKARAAIRGEARRRLLAAAGVLTGCVMPGDTVIVSTSGRNDYRCKGFDVYLEALARLRAQLNAEGGGRQVLALIEVPCWLKGPREDLAARLAGTDDTCTEPLPNPTITHELHHLGEDRIFCEINRLGLANLPADRLKVLLVPCYLDGRDGIFDMPYYELLTANDLTLYPSYYEPWGYTPLESCAFGVPCATTDLSGFGQWVDSTLGRSGTLADGVEVLHRTDANFSEVADGIVRAIRGVSQAAPDALQAMAAGAESFAEKARWQHFIGYYIKAYDFALAECAPAQPEVKTSDLTPAAPMSAGGGADGAKPADAGSAKPARKSAPKKNTAKPARKAPAPAKGKGAGKAARK